MPSPRKQPAKSLLLEKLESREMFAADWQNPSLMCDVDGNQIVSPLDVLILINSINRDGDRALAQKSPTDPFYDVDGDDRLSSVDVLRVINVINRAMPELGVTAGPSTAFDADNNGVISSSSFAFAGTTGIGSTVELMIEGEANNIPVVVRTTANEQGAFSINVPLQGGLNQVSIQVRDEIGRTVNYKSTIRRGDLISQWNSSILKAIRTLASGVSWSDEQAATVKPPYTARNFAMMYGAMFEAVNAVNGNYQSKLSGIQADPTANAVVAASTAAHRIASAAYPDLTSVEIFNNTLAETLATIPDDTAKQRGTALGIAIANAMLQLRANDGSHESVHGQFSNDPGKWAPAPPDYEVTLEQWPDVTPFVIASGDAFRPGPAPALSSAEYAAAVDQVMRLGGKTSTERTADQTQIALFWADGMGSATPPGHWNQIAVDVLAGRNLSLLDQTRAMALLNYAMADAGIASWDAKYHYDFWRPVEAIRRADADSNAATTADPNWQSLIVTPTFPSYTSGHSTFSGAACAVLTALFGTSVSFRSQKDQRPEWKLTPEQQSTTIFRSYASFAEAAEEAGMSRIYGGIHYSFDNRVGLDTGIAIGNYIVAHGANPRSS